MRGNRGVSASHCTISASRLRIPRGSSSHPYEPDSGSVRLWQPSNIVQHLDDNFFYMLAQVDIHQGERNVVGRCLLRTDDLSDPSSWRAWDGSGFEYGFVDPCTPGAEPGEPCTSVANAPAWSLTYNTYLEQFVMLTETPRQLPTGNRITRRPVRRSTRVIWRSLKTSLIGLSAWRGS